MKALDPEYPRWKKFLKIPPVLLMSHVTIALAEHYPTENKRV